MKGKFIVLEGPDRCGKSTQAKLLLNTLLEHGKDVILTREPGGTETAEKIRQIVLEPDLDVRPMAELFLYEASRAQHTQEKILPALQEGKIVLCERYTMSTCAYQGYGRNIDLKTIDTLKGYLELTKKTKNAYLIDADKNVDVIAQEVAELLHKCKILD